MSTFGGYIPEFPDIRVDNFSRISGLRPPLACFLSHVHTDHLAGLENFKSPFLYCSAATRELLLRLERYPHRINIAKGILVPRKQHYKHLQNLLKPIPLETPTCIELEPGNEIQVTLFDANHCTGAVMFLIEDDSKAVLYTGDIRSEPWFVNSLIRNPFLIQYTSGLKRLDCIYLDTSNISPTKFPTKAEGLRELLEKVLMYPPETVFHFTAWTFGYEEVWMALSRALKSQVHVDNYKLKLYRSLGGSSTDSNNTQFLTNDGRVLAGYQCGNNIQLGYLTNDVNVRIHSCEKGSRCGKVDQNTVYIRPIIARNGAGQELGEVGVGGGGGDLGRRPELELDDPYIVDELLSHFENTDEAIMKEIKGMIADENQSAIKTLFLDNLGLELDGFGIEDLVKALTEEALNKRKNGGQNLNTGKGGLKLPRKITFPYSRHSSYEELCHLVGIFDPKDIYPCTVNEKTWSSDVSMHTLFSGHCSATRFRHDEEMREKYAGREKARSFWRRRSHLNSPQTQTTERTESSEMLPPISPLQRIVTKSKRNQESIESRGMLQTTLYSNSAAISRSRHSSPGMNMERQKSATPHQDSFSTSPGSVSQSMRRKAIEEAMDGGPVKRTRFDLDSTDVSSSPGGIFHLAGPAQVTGTSQSTSSSKDADTTPNTSTYSGSQEGEVGDFLTSDDEAGFWERTFWDKFDGIHRCSKCGHEIWSLFGFCSTCDEGPQCIPYHEHLGSDGIPEFVANRRLGPGEKLTGDFLDCNSSAYDTQDEEKEFREEYETNSFIDDEVIPDDPEDEDTQSSSDGESDYKTRYVQLQAELAATHKEKEVLESQIKKS